MNAMRIALVLAVVSLAGCSSVPQVAGDSIFHLRPGQAIAVADAGRLRYDAVVNDSRCRPDVQCVWAGDAAVGFTWQGADGQRDAFSLHTGRGDKSHRIGDRTVTLVALGRRPLPEATLQIAAGG